VDEIEYYGAVCMGDEYLKWIGEFTGKAPAQK
jgi:hypothetical protein